MSDPVSKLARYAALTPVLRLEAVAATAGAVLAYHRSGGALWLFVVLVFVPDLSMAGYLLGPRAGARLYNTVHTYVAPALLAAIGLALRDVLVVQIAAIWVAHIGFDRALGFGLKLAGGFRETHLGPFPRAAGPSRAAAGSA